MKLSLKRFQCGVNCTIGKLFVDGVFECYTCEDVVREDGVKVYGETAIPAGEYGVIVTRSARFGVDMPLLLNVPNFEGIRIHTGNTAADTHGCLLVGQHTNPTGVSSSRLAYAELFPKIQAALDRDEAVSIKIEDAL